MRMGYEKYKIVKFKKDNFTFLGQNRQVYLAAALDMSIKVYNRQPVVVLSAQLIFHWRAGLTWGVHLPLKPWYRELLVYMEFWGSR